MNKLNRTREEWAAEPYQRDQPLGIIGQALTDLETLFAENEALEIAQADFAQIIAIHEAEITDRDARIAELEAEIIARKGLCDAQKHMNGMFRAQIDMFTNDVIKADALDDALKLGMIDRLCKGTQKHHDRDTETIKKQEEWVTNKFGWLHPKEEH